QPSRAGKRLSEGTRSGLLRDPSPRDRLSNQVDQPGPPLGAERAVERAYLRIALGGVDERGHTRRVRRLLDELRDLLEEADHPLAPRTGAEDERLRLHRAERVLDERELARPVPVDRALSDTRARRDRLDRERAVTDLAELRE